MKNKKFSASYKDKVKAVRSVVEAIMWHGYSQESDAYNEAVKFYNLSKEDRDAVVAFIEAI